MGTGYVNDAGTAVELPNLAPLRYVNAAGVAVQLGGEDVTNFLSTADWDEAYDGNGPAFQARALADLAQVAVWDNEMSPGSRDFEQATALNQPLFVQSNPVFNGYPTVRTNGTTTHMRTPGWPDEAQPHTVAVVVLRHIDKPAGAVVDGHQTTSKIAVAVNSGATLHLDAGSGAGVDTPVNFSGEAPNAIIIEFNGAASQAWVNGAVDPSWAAALASDPVEGLTFGDSAEISGALKALDGDTAFIGRKHGTLTAEQRAAFFARANALTGCEDVSTGMGVYADAWCRPANEADGDIVLVLKRTPTAGHKMIVSLVAQANHGTHAVVDDSLLPGAWVKSGAVFDQAARGTSIWYKIANGDETEVTVDAGSGFLRAEYQEAPNLGAVNAATGGPDGGVISTSVTPTITTTVARTIVFFVVHLAANGAEVSWSDGFHSTEGNTARLHTARKVFDSAGVKSSVFVWSGLQRSSWVAIAFEEAP